MKQAGKLAEEQTPTLVSIQALRAIAAFMVLAFHLNLYLAEIAPRLQTTNFVLGAAGVDLFFVISGFVMVYSCERLFERPGASTQFVVQRLVRIVPLYWLATTAMVLLCAPFASTKAVIASLLFWPYPAGGAPVLNVGWTLNFEMFFYLVFAAALLIKRRAMVAASAGTFLVAFAWLGPGSGPLAHFTNPIIIEFVFGMLIAVIYRAEVRLPLWLTMALLAGGLALYAAILPDVATPGSKIPRQFSWGIAASFVVAAVALSEVPRPAALAIGIIVFLGDMSYALYLTHPLTLQLVGPTVASIVWPHVWLYGTAMVVICLAVAAATHLLIERPITGTLRRWIDQAKVAGLPARDRLGARCVAEFRPG